MYSLRIQKKWVEKLAKQIPTLCERGDNVNVWGIPAVGLSTYARELVTATTDKRTKVVYLDTRQLIEVTADSFFSLMGSELALLATGNLPDKDLSPSEIINLIAKVTLENNLCIIIDRLDSLRALENTSLKFLISLRGRFMGRLSFILVSTKPLDEDEHYRNYSHFIDFACHKEVISGPFGEDRYKEIIPKVKEFSSKKLTDKEITKLFEMSGGIFGFLKNMLRTIEDEDSYELTPEFMLKDSSVENRLTILFESLSYEEKEYLCALSKGEKPKKEVKTKYLTESGLLENGKIRSTLLAAYMKDQKCEDIEASPKEPKKEADEAPEQTVKAPENGLEINLKSGEISKDGKRLSSILSEGELKIVKFMINQNEKDEVTTREDIALQIWGDKYMDEYSDWAIDKAISRIRKKLQDSKRPYKYLITIKGKGFKLHLS